MKGHTGCVNSVAIIPDPLKIVSESDDNTIKIWNYEEDKTRTLIPYDYSPKSIIINDENNT